MSIDTPTRIDRVVVVSDELAASGGAAAVAALSIDRLAARGVAVTALLGSEAAYAPPDGVEVVPLGGTRISEAAGAGEALAGLFHAGVHGRIRRWIAGNDTPGTLYHLHNWHKALSPSALLALRPVAARLVVNAHDYFLVCPNGGYFNYRSGAVCALTPMSPRCAASNCDKRRYAHKAWRLARQGLRAALFPLSSSPAVVLAPHEAMTDFLARGGVRRDRVCILGNPVTPWRDRRVEAERQKRVLFVGRLEPDKGVDLLSEAADRCGVGLTVVGDGSLFDPLRRRFPRHEFTGWRSGADLSKLAAQARLVVVPTLWPETFCLTAFEAATSGIPVLISRNALVAAELVERDAAEGFDPRNLDAAAAKLRRLLGDPARLGFLSRRAFGQRRLLAASPADWSDGLLAIYRGLLARAGDGWSPPARATPPAAPGGS